MIAPEVVKVNHAGLLDAFETARLSQAEAWEELLAAEQLDRVAALDIPAAPGDFHFPAELWIRCLYDALVAYHRPGIDRERLLAALTPLYFGRTAGFIAETDEMSTEQAERVIEAQAREFEEIKPYLVSRWREMRAAGAA